MLVQKKISRIAAVAVVAAVVSAPSAGAMPIDGPGERPVAAAPDLRTEANRGPSVSPAPPVGLPTWPSDPKPIAPAAPEPAAAEDSGGGGLDWTTALIIAAGVLAVTGGVVALVHQMRLPRSRPAH